MSATDVFAVPVFFICFRECVESSIIVSVLLAFLGQTLSGDAADDLTRKRLNRQVWLGVGLGLLICLAIGGGMIGAFYTLSQDYFASTEDIWEGVFSIVASVIIGIMGAALLRVNKLQDKWRVKLMVALEAEEKKKMQKSKIGIMRRMGQWSERHVMFLLPFVTVLREGLEAVVYIGGVSLGLPAKSFPLAVVCGLGAGVLVGYLLYKGGNTASMQIFLIISTCFLYLIAAGLFSKAVWYLENYQWGLIIGGDAAETGSGAGSYDITKSVWHVNCCNPEINGGGGWGIFNAIFGWQNSATYGTVISYNVYWIFVIAAFLAMGYHERNGHLGPFTPVFKFFSRKKGNKTVEAPSAGVLEHSSAEVVSPVTDEEKKVAAAVTAKTSES